MKLYFYFKRLYVGNLCIALNLNQKTSRSLVLSKKFRGCIRLAVMLPYKNEDNKL